MSSTRYSPLKSLKVASPCPALWEDMYGDSRVRFCGQCSLNVYNLSGMTTEDAERVIAEHEGRLCVRYYRREDGTVLTQDCPVGLAAFRAKVRRFAVASASFVLSFLTAAALTLGLQPKTRRSSGSAFSGGAKTWKQEPYFGGVCVEQGEMVVPPNGQWLAGAPTIDPPPEQPRRRLQR